MMMATTELTNDQVITAHNVTAIGFDLATDELEGRRLAGAVAADQTHALASLDRKSSLTQYLQLTEVQ